MSDGPSIDETLMKQIAEHHRGSLEMLVTRHAAKLMTFIVRMIGDHHRSEEIFQDVVFDIWNKRHQYEFPRPVRPWLFTIAINRCKQEFRKKPPPLSNQELSLSLIKDDQPPEQMSMWLESSGLIKHAVERLPEQQRAVVVLRIWNGMSYREIGEVVGANESTVRSYMHHALKSLRGMLEPHGL